MIYSKHLSNIDLVYVRTTIQGLYWISQVAWIEKNGY